MPELPEVETLVRGARDKLVGKTIKEIEVLWSKTVKGDLRKIKSAKIAKVRRRGKLLIFELGNGWSFIIHLKLTGQLIYQDPKETLYKGGHRPPAGGKVLYGAPLPHKYTVVEIGFADSSRLYFNDLRKFGWLKILKTSEVENQKEFKELGLEPLSKDFTLKKFEELLKRRPNQKIKEFLMEQTLLAGIGNIYSSEILWEAYISPLRQIKTLKPEEIKKFFEAIPKILKKAIELGGSSENTYVRLNGSKGNFMNYAKVYQKEGESCKRNDGGKIKRVKIGQRSAFYCPVCQK